MGYTGIGGIPGDTGELESHSVAPYREAVKANHERWMVGDLLADDGHVRVLESLLVDDTHAERHLGPGVEVAQDILGGLGLDMPPDDLGRAPGRTAGVRD